MADNIQYDGPPQGYNAFMAAVQQAQAQNMPGLTMVDIPQQPMFNNTGPGAIQRYGMPQLMGPNSDAGGGLKNWFSNGENLGTAIQGFGTLASAYMGFQQLKQAKEGLKFQKEAFNANLGNSIKNYNTTLEDRIRGRTSAYEGKENDVSSYLAKNSLKR